MPWEEEEEKKEETEPVCFLKKRRRKIWSECVLAGFARSLEGAGLLQKVGGTAELMSGLPEKPGCRAHSRSTKTWEE